MSNESREQAAARQRARRAKNPARESVRERIRRQVRIGELVRAEVCEKCDAAVGKTWVHLRDELDASTITWLCPSCYWLVNPRRRPTHRVVRGDTMRVAPSYERMKFDYCVRGLTLVEMAAEYGYRNPEGKRATVHATLKRRAMRRGEWPLVQGNKLSELRTAGIWLAVASHLSDAVDRHNVFVPDRVLNAFVPRSSHPTPHSACWQTTFPKMDARYHYQGCNYLPDQTPTSIPYYAMPREQAEDWGFTECDHCAAGMAVATFAQIHGISTHFMHGLSSGRERTISKDKARLLLTAIGDPIPKDLQPPKTTIVGRRRENQEAA